MENTNTNVIDAEVKEQVTAPETTAMQPTQAAPVAEEPKPKKGLVKKILIGAGVVLTCFGLGAAVGSASAKKKQKESEENVVDADNSSAETTEF